MEKQCSRCGKVFQPSTEDQSVCSVCVGEEFSAAPVVSSAPPADVWGQNKVAILRQEARAKRMRTALHREQPYSMFGLVRCVIALVLFCIVLLIFLFGDTPLFKPMIDSLSIEYRFVVSIGASLISVCLLLPSFRRKKVLISLLCILMLAIGAAMPLFSYDNEQEQADAASDAKETPQNAQSEVQGTEASRDLTKGDLSVFYSHRKEAPRGTHFAIYITQQNSALRSLVREILTRLMQAEYTRAYTRGNGALYVVVNARVPYSVGVRVASRFGSIKYANPQEGIYEVGYNEEKLNVVSPYSAEVLGSPTNPNFVAGNVSELLCMDATRVGSAAKLLASANVQYLRRDIRNALVQVLRDPWDSEPETQQALLEALDVYAPAGDTEVITLFKRYFSMCREQRRAVSPQVMQRLIAEEPDAMLEPVVQLWVANPITWRDMITAFGSRAEEKLLEKMATSDIQLLDAILKYLGDFGTPAAIPALENLSQHPDTLIRHKARTTLEEILKRKS